MYRDQQMNAADVESAALRLFIDFMQLLAVDLAEPEGTADKACAEKNIGENPESGVYAGLRPRNVMLVVHCDRVFSVNGIKASYIIGVVMIVLVIVSGEFHSFIDLIFGLKALAVVY